MSKTSIADAIVAWESALTNAKTGATEVPGIEGYTAPLEQILAEAKALTARLDDRKSLKQQDTAERKSLMKKGNFQVSRIRSAIKAFFGPNNERVIAFGARPLRPRTRKTPNEPAAPPAAAPGPEVPEGSKPDAGTRKENEAPRNPTAL
jgi:hypothetical protein